MNYKAHIADREEKSRWIKANQERMDELAEEMIDRMDMSDLIGFAKDALERDWVDYPEGFETEWKKYLVDKS